MNTNSSLSSDTSRRVTGLPIAITGASGLVGSTLATALAGRRQSVLRFVRGVESPTAEQIAWDPAQGKIEAAKLEGVDAVVHLAGENIAEGRWNAAKKKRLRDSRVEGTKLLCETLAKLPRKPRVLVSASAIGYYGDRGDVVLSEESGPGQGFLPNLCLEWERATESAARAGIRVVNLRIGVVISRKGGALAKMLTPFKFGLGGRIGSGGQYWSWIALEDLVGSILHCIDHDSLRGPVNAVSPNPLTNRDFTATLAKVLRRPAIFPMPAFAARLVLGEMADELLLASARLTPVKLKSTGYVFRHPTLDGAIRAALES